jgi:fatty acid-binding protein DegV
MINIICDTTSCISKEIAERYKIPAIVTHAGPGVPGVGFFVRE